MLLVIFIDLILSVLVPTYSISVAVEIVAELVHSRICAF